MSCEHVWLRTAVAARDYRVSFADEHLPPPRACISCERMWGEGARPCEHCSRMLLPYRRRRAWAWCPVGHWVRTSELERAGVAA